MIFLTVNELCKALNLSEINLSDGEREIKGVYCGDLLSWVMGKAQEDNAWITIMSNINVVAVASLSDVSCVILSEGVRLSDDAHSAAKSKNVNILSSDKSTYELAVSLSQVL